MRRTIWITAMLGTLLLAQSSAVAQKPRPIAAVDLCIIHHQNGSEDEWADCTGNMTKAEVLEEFDDHVRREHGGYGMFAYIVDGPCEIGEDKWWKFSWFYDGGIQ